MPTIHVEIPGEVKGLARPRATKSKGHARMYDPESNAIEKGRLQMHLLKALEEFNPGMVVCGPKGFNVDIEAYIACPKSMSKKMRAAALEGEVRPKRKPDIDNIAKLILDAWNNGVLWEDDKDVSTLWVKKRYGEKEHLEVTVNWEEP